MANLRLPKSMLVFGANTDVGKTVLSAGLVQAALRVGQTQYIKPLQTGALTGYDTTADECTIRARVGASPSAHAFIQDRLTSSTLFCWSEARSAHEAAAMAMDTLGSSIPDTQQVVDAIVREVVQGARGSDDAGVSIIETAGGVLSPGATGEPQCDTYTRLAPLLSDPNVLLVGDAKLGGISVTLASIESLWQRRYPVPVIAFVEESGYDNASFVREWVNKTNDFTSDALRGGNGHVDVLVFPPLPPDEETLTEWYSANDHLFDDLFTKLTKG